VTTDQILAGLGLTLALAVGSQVVARLLHLPALIVLLPVGFVAGALTNVVNPNDLLGPLFQPLVSLAVAVILFESGLGLGLKGLRGHSRQIVGRLIGLGIPITCAIGAVSAALFLGMSARAALMLGAILVVSGPTVVAPLLASIGLERRLQTVLVWEGSIIDPIGAVFGVLVFHGVIASARPSLLDGIANYLASLGVGLAGGLVGTAVLWLLLRRWSLAQALGTEVALATVVAVAAACDILRDDSGLIAAIVMGMALANLRGFDLPARRPFFETVIQLIIGVLFVSISASVTPASVRGVLVPALALAAVLVLVARPLVALASSLRTDLPWRGRAFLGWMHPRGIVAASTASTFSASLVSAGVPDASKILPSTFVVIVATVVVYGLTAGPVARLLRVTRPARSRPLLVGGTEWVLGLGRALQSAGLSVVMWAAAPHQRERIRRAGLELAAGELLANATGRGAELEGISTVLLLTPQDDFNALVALTMQDGFDGEVYRVAPPRQELGVVSPFTGDEVLFGEPLTGVEIFRRYQQGAEIVARSAAEGGDVAGLLFVVRADGRLAPVTTAGRPGAEAGDTLVLLGPVPPASAERRPRTSLEEELRAFLGDYAAPDHAAEER
jgi:NhaP-type Na+/H+ or K+/H+ antiporter